MTNQGICLLHLPDSFGERILPSADDDGHLVGLPAGAADRDHGSAGCRRAARRAVRRAAGRSRRPRSRGGGCRSRRILLLLLLLHGVSATDDALAAVCALHLRVSNQGDLRRARVPGHDGGRVLLPGALLRVGPGQDGRQPAEGRQGGVGALAAVGATELLELVLQRGHGEGGAELVPALVRDRAQGGALRVLGISAAEETCSTKC